MRLEEEWVEIVPSLLCIRRPMMPSLPIDGQRDIQTARAINYFNSGDINHPCSGSYVIYIVLSPLIDSLRLCQLFFELLITCFAIPGQTIDREIGRTIAGTIT